MTGERRPTAPTEAAAPAEAPPEGGGPPGTPMPGTRTSGARAPGPRTPEPDPQDRDPSGTGPPRPEASGSDPRPGPAGTRALIRAQLRTALGTGAIVAAVLAGLPALLAFVPAIAEARVRGVPLPWPVLALGIQPVWIAVSFRQLRRAERTEREMSRP